MGFVCFYLRHHYFSWHAALCSIDRDYRNPTITPASKSSFFMAAFSNLRVNEGELFWQDRSAAILLLNTPPHFGCCSRLTCADRTKARQALHLKPPSHLIRAARLSSLSPPVSAITLHLMRRTHQTPWTLTLQGLRASHRGEPGYVQVLFG